MAFSAIIASTGVTFVAFFAMILVVSVGPLAAVGASVAVGQATFGLVIAKALICQSLRGVPQRA